MSTFLNLLLLHNCENPGKSAICMFAARASIVCRTNIELYDIQRHPVHILMIAPEWPAFAAVLLVLPVVSGRLLITEPCSESGKTEVDPEPESSHAAFSASRSCLRPARRTIPWRWHLPAALVAVGDVRYEGNQADIGGRSVVLRLVAARCFVRPRDRILKRSLA